MGKREGLCFLYLLLHTFPCLLYWLVLFYYIVFYYYTLQLLFPDCFPMKDRNEVDPDERGGEEELGRV